MSHHGTNAVDYSDEWHTPPEVFDALSVRKEDMRDPFMPDEVTGFSCHNDAWCAQEYCWWFNPPFSRIAEIVPVLHGVSHYLFICFARTETDWFQRALLASDVLLCLNWRVNYIDMRKTIAVEYGPMFSGKRIVDNPHYGKQHGSPGAPSVIMAKGKMCHNAALAAANGYGVVSLRGA